MVDVTFFVLFLNLSFTEVDSAFFIHDYTIYSIIYNIQSQDSPNPVFKLSITLHYVLIVSPSEIKEEKLKEIDL